MQIENTYDKKQKLIREAIISAAKKQPTEILKSEAKEAKQQSEGNKNLCEATRILFNEGLEQFEKGLMTFEEFVKDLSRSLLAIKDVIK